MKTSKLGKILLVALFIMLFTLVLTVSASAATTNVAANADLSDAIASAADGDVLVLGGGTYTETAAITINKNLTIQGTGTVNGGAPIFNVAEGVTVTFGGSVKYVGGGIGVSIQGTNTNVTFKDSVCFETTSRVYSDLNNAYTSTVTVQDNAFFKSSSYAIDFDGKATTTGTRAKKTVVMTGGTFNCQHGIVFNADYIDATATVTGGTMVNTSTCVYTTNNNGPLSLTISGGSFTTSNDRVVMVDGNASSTATVSITGVTLNSTWANANSGAIYTGNATVTLTVKDVTVNTPNVALVCCASAKLTATLENVTATCLDVVNENGANGKADVTIKGTSNITAGIGLFSDGTASGSSMKLTIAGGKVKAASMISSGTGTKASLAVASTLNVTGGELELDTYGGLHTNLTINLTGGTVKASGITVTALNNTEAVAKIGDTTYNTLEAAIAAAAAGDTITVLKDCTISANVTLNKKLTFTGANVTVLLESAQFLLTDGADVTFGGSMSWMGFGVFTNSGTTKLTFNGGAYYASSSLIDSDDQAILTVNITAGTFIGSGDADFPMFLRTDDPNDSTNGQTTTMNISGGVFRSKGSTMFRSGNSANKCIFNINISAGEFYMDTVAANSYFFVNNDWQGAGSQFVITGGTFTVTNPDTTLNIGFLIKTEHAIVTISNATFIGVDRLFQVERATNASKTVFTVNSGTFDVATILFAYGNNGIKSNNVLSEAVVATLNIKGGSFTVADRVLHIDNPAAKSTSATVNISGGTFSKMTNFMTGYNNSTVTLNISNVTLNTTGHFFVSSATNVTLNATFEDCVLSAGQRFVGTDFKAMTFEFIDTNVTAYDRMFNVTGGANAANITITGGTFTINVGTDKHALMFYSSSTGTSTVTINSGTFINNGDGTNQWDTLFALNGGSTKMNVTIKDGTFNSKQIMQQGNGTLSITIEKGTYTGTFYAKGGTVNLTIKGGTFTSTENLINTVYGNTLNLTVMGGTYNAGNYFLYAPTTGADGSPKWSGATVTINVSGSPEITATNHIFCFYNNAIVNLTVNGGTYSTPAAVVNSNGARLVATWNSGTVTTSKRFMDTLWGENSKYVTDPLGEITDAAMIITVNGGNVTATERMFSLTDRGKHVFRVNGGTFEVGNLLFYSSRNGEYNTLMDIYITGGTFNCTLNDNNGGIIKTLYRMNVSITGGNFTAATAPIFMGDNDQYLNATVSGGTFNALALININNVGIVDVALSGTANVTLTKAMFNDDNNSASSQVVTMTGGTLSTPLIMPYPNIRNTTAATLTGGTLVLNGKTFDLDAMNSGAVAKTEDGTTFSSLAAAIAAAPAGSTVTLLTDAVICESIVIDKKLTITGGSANARITVLSAVHSEEFYDATGFSAFSTFIIRDGADLTIDGYVDYYETGFTSNHATGSVTLQGNISITNVKTSVVSNANAEGGKVTLTVTINGGTYTVGSGNMFYSGSKIEGNKGDTVVKYTVNGGTFNGQTIFSSGDWQAYMYVTVNGGSFTMVNHLAYNGASDVHVTLNGGTYTGFSTLIMGARCDTYFTVSENANITATGGTLVSAVSNDNAQNYAKVTAVIKSGTYTLTNHVAYAKNNDNGTDVSTMDVTVYGGTFNTGNNAFWLVTGTYTATIYNMSLTTAGAGLRADGGVYSATIHNATITTTSSTANTGTEPFYFADACTNATLVVKAGTYTANAGLRGLMGRAKKGSYTFGVEGETDHSKLVITSDNQQVFAFHTGSSIDLTLVVYSGTYTVTSAPLLDINDRTTGSITLHNGIYNSNSPSHSLIDLTGSVAANPSHVNITVKAGTYNVAHGYFINYSHCLQGKNVTITLNNPTVTFKNAGGQVVQVNGTGTNISYADVYITGGTYTNAAQMVHFDQCIGKIVISGGTAVLTSPFNTESDVATGASQNGKDNFTDNDAYLIQLTGGACKLLEGSEISGGNYTITLIDVNTGAIAGNSSVPANIVISGGTINVTNGPLFGWYTHWTANITGGTITCKWLVNVNGGACVENITLSDNANVTCTDCVVTDGGAGSRVHIQVNGGYLNGGLSWSTGLPLAATCTAQVTGGTVLFDGHTLYGNGAKAVEGADGTRYATLQEAIDAASDGDTLTIIGSFVINEIVNVTKNITIAGGSAEAGIVVSGNVGKDGRAYQTFRVKDGAHLTLDGFVTYYLVGIVMEGGSTVTITGNTVVDNIRGTSKWSDVIAAPGNGDRTINVSGNAYLMGDYVISFQGGTDSIFTGNKVINMTGGKLEGNYCVVINEGGSAVTATFENCVMSAGTTALYLDGSYDATNKNVVSFTLNEGVELTAKNIIHTLNHLSHLNVTVNGGEYTLSNYGFHILRSVATLTFNGGEFTVNGDRFFNSTTNADCVSTVVFYGGTVTMNRADSTGHSLMFYANDGVTMNITIHGGTFNNYSTETDEHNSVFETNTNTQTTKMNVTLNGGTFNVFNLIWAYGGVVSFTDNGATLNIANTKVIAGARYEQGNATVYGNIYSTVVNAPAGSTITLMQSVTLSDAISITKDVTLTGFATITGASGKAIFTIDGAAKLTLDGKLTCSASYSVVRINASATAFDATVHFKGGTFTNSKSDGNGEDKAIFTDLAPLCNVTVVIEEGVVMTYKGWGVAVFDSADNSAETTALKTLTFNGGTFNGGHGVVVGAKAANYKAKYAITVNGGSFTLVNEGFWLRSVAKGNTITINDGSFDTASHVILVKTTTTDVTAVINGGNLACKNGVYCETSSVCDLTINGGTINATTHAFVSGATSKINVTITGGTLANAGNNALFNVGAYTTGGTTGRFNITGGTFTGYRIFNVSHNYNENAPTMTVDGVSGKLFDYVFTISGGAFTSTDRTFSIVDYTHVYLELSGGTFNGGSSQVIYHTDHTDNSDTSGNRGKGYAYVVVTGTAALTTKGNLFHNGDGTASLIVKADGEGNAPVLTTGSWLIYASWGGTDNILSVDISAGTFQDFGTADQGGLVGVSNSNAKAVELNVTLSGGTYNLNWQLFRLNGTTNAVIEISGGDYTASQGVRVDTYATTVDLNVTGGTFNMVNSLVYGAESTSATIPTLDVTLGDTTVVNAVSVIDVRRGYNLTLAINGGTYTSTYTNILVGCNATANITGGTFEGLALYTHGTLNWAPTIGDDVVINTTHRDYHHATYTDGTNTYCGSIEAVAGAVPAGSTITLVGQLPSGIYTIGKNVIITGGETDSLGDTTGQTQIRPAAGVSVSLMGGTFINATVYANNNVSVTFGGNVTFQNGTSYQVFEDQDGNNTVTVTIQDNAYLQGRWVIDFEGKDTTDSGYAHHTGKKTVIMTGGTIVSQYGIVFNVDGVTADLQLKGGSISATSDAIYLNAGNGNGQRISLLIDGTDITANALGINTVDVNVLADIVMKSGSITAGADGNATHSGDYCVELWGAPTANPSTFTMLGGSLYAVTAHAAIHVYSNNNANTKDEAPKAFVYGGYIEGHTLCAARSTTGGWLVIYGGYFAYIPELYTNDGSPVRSGTGSETGHVEVYGGNFHNAKGFGSAINCVNEYSYLTVNIQGITALGGQYITPSKTNSVQNRYPDGDHEYEGLISMIDGAGVRLYPNSNGLRFVSVVSGSSLNYLRTLGASNFRYGTLIAPVDEVEKANAFTIADMNLAGAQYINLPAANGLIEREDGGYYIRAALVNIREENIGRDFAAVGYVQYDLNGYTVTIYTAYRATRNARSIEQVARLALKDAEKYTPAQQAILETFAPTEAAPVIDFYLVAGQSNAAGSSNWNANIQALRPEYTEGFSHVLYSGSSNTIHRLNTVTKLGYGSASDTFGPELGMADALSQYYNEETGRYAAIIKYAYGGTSLYDNVSGSDAYEGNWVPPSWLEQVAPKDSILTGGLFRALVNHVENSIAEYEAMGFDVNIVAAYWMQGESDVSRHAADGLYDDMFKCWINDLRSALVEMTGEEKYESLPILVGEISEYFNRQVEDTYQLNCMKFVQMQREIIGSWDNVYVISNGNIPTDDHNNDMAHWGYHQALWIGQHIGQTILTELLGQEIVVPEDQIVAELWLDGQLIGVYSELAGAINMAPEGSVVKILKDLDMYSNMVIGNRNQFTIDGNGHTLTFKTVDGKDKEGTVQNKYHSAMKFYSVDLTIKDLFVISTNNAWGSQLFMNSKLTWIGGGFEAQELCFVMNDHGELNIHGGEFTTRGTTNSGFGVIYMGSAKNQSLTITDGVFNAGETGAGSAVIVTTAPTSMTVTITGGTFIGAPETDVVIDINCANANVYLTTENITVIGGTTAGIENSGNTTYR